MLSVFSSDFLEKGATIEVAYYANLDSKLREVSKKKRRGDYATVFSCVKMQKL